MAMKGRIESFANAHIVSATIQACWWQNMKERSWQTLDMSSHLFWDPEMRYWCNRFDARSGKTYWIKSERVYLTFTLYSHTYSLLLL